LHLRVVDGIDGASYGHSCQHRANRDRRGGFD